MESTLGGKAQGSVNATGVGRISVGSAGDSRVVGAGVMGRAGQLARDRSFASVWRLT